MSAEGHAALEQALQLSTQMLGAAQAQDWGTVVELRPDYDDVLRRGTPVTDASREILTEILQQHQQLAQLTDQARQLIGKELEQQQRNHRALNAYLMPCDED